jgi:putative nucleotidyltransferase with HDIG domain
MTRAAQFLGSFGRALSAFALYREGHPTLERAIETTWQDLDRLLAVGTPPVFTFLGETVLYRDVPLSDRRVWEWAERLAGAGIQRVEFDASLTRDAFEGFLCDVSARLAHREPGSACSRSLAAHGIRFGPVGLRGEATTPEAAMPTATLAFPLDEEIDTVRWVHEEVKGSHLIPLAEVETIVRSLTVAMHADPQIVLPLVQIKEFDEYTTTHSLNVSVLAMGLAERLGLEGSAVRAYGVAGLLHDIGKTLIPRDILTKPGRFTDAERAIMNRHPADGARLILRSDQGLDLAAIVAYEHHIMIDGGGFPPLRARRACHEASRLVHVCDVFDALRTRRPYRDTWPVGKVIAYLRERSDKEFDRQIVAAFVAMVEDCAAAAPHERVPA